MHIAGRPVAETALRRGKLHDGAQCLQGSQLAVRYRRRPCEVKPVSVSFNQEYPGTAHPSREDSQEGCGCVVCLPLACRIRRRSARADLREKEALVELADEQLVRGQDGTRVANGVGRTGQEFR